MMHIICHVVDVAGWRRHVHRYCCDLRLGDLVHHTTVSLVEETIYVVAPVMALFVTSIGLGDVILEPVAA